MAWHLPETEQARWKCTSYGIFMCQQSAVRAAWLAIRRQCCQHWRALGQAGLEPCLLAGQPRCGQRDSAWAGSRAAGCELALRRHSFSGRRGSSLGDKAAAAAAA